MIDCLCNSNWINPQIDLLLFLQNLRIGHLECFDKFFLSVTVFGEFWLPSLLCAIVYWCFDFKAGLYLFSLESFNMFITHLLKIIAGVYRPWIISDKICPSKEAFAYAQGYSFPSGHSATSSSIWGGLAFLLYRKTAIFILLIGLILLIGFSRLWLGVHTPQDVLSGFLIGITLIFTVDKIINWAEKNKNRYWYLLLIINFLATLAVIYMCYIHIYRTEYVGGELLVNPYKVAYVNCGFYAYALGLINGCFLCRIFKPFNPKHVSVKSRITRGIIGFIGVIILVKYLFRYITLGNLTIKMAMISMFLIGIIITLIYPIIFLFVEKQLKMK